MSPYECYVAYTALKTHFNSKSYDYKKFNGKIKSANAFNYKKTNCELFYQKLSKHKNPVDFLVSNFIVDQNIWIRNIVYDPKAETIYQDWMKRQQSLEYLFKLDINKLYDNFNNNLLVTENNTPYLLKLYLGDDISFETFIILCNLSKCVPYWDSKMKNDIIWGQVKFKMDKYNTFLVYDKSKMKKILLDKFTKK